MKNLKIQIDCSEVPKKNYKTLRQTSPNVACVVRNRGSGLPDCVAWRDHSDCVIMCEESGETYVAIYLSRDLEVIRVLGKLSLIFEL